MAAVLRSLLVDSEPAGAPRPGRRDAGAAVALLLFGLADIPEGVDLYQPVSALAVVVAASAVIWRRAHPLAAVTVAFGAQFLVDLLSGLADAEAEAPAGQLVVLAVLAYALTRWAGWRAIATGVALMMLLGAAGQLVSRSADWGEVADQVLVWGIGAAVGAAIRYRAASLWFRAEQVRAEERERIARELHDVVAHHVSAIAIQAEGARAVADSDPAGAGEALVRIHDTASRALVDMRQVVSILRDTEPGDLAPRARMADIRALATSGTEVPGVDVSVRGPVEALPTGVMAALYRIAQEAVTNARLHAGGATSVSITVTREPRQVSLAVVDDGRGAGQLRDGFGLVGMSERAAMLGGTFRAGPRPDGVGWQVLVTIPADSPVDWSPR
ncbi:MAG: sensor histidine kinase [Acidimicrobiales bacterium]